MTKSSYLIYKCEKSFWGHRRKYVLDVERD